MSCIRCEYGEHKCSSCGASMQEASGCWSSAILYILTQVIAVALLISAGYCDGRINAIEKRLGMERPPIHWR